LDITFAPGDIQPANKSKRKVWSRYPYFNYTDVEFGLSTDATGHVVGYHVDLVNGSEHMYLPDKNPLMCITNDMKYGYETYSGDPANGFNSPWDDYYNEGYPPFQLIIPGCARSRFYNGVIGINILIRSSTR